MDKMFLFTIVCMSERSSDHVARACVKENSSVNDFKFVNAPIDLNKYFAGLTDFPLYARI